MTFPTLSDLTGVLRGNSFTKDWVKGMNKHSASIWTWLLRYCSHLLPAFYCSLARARIEQMEPDSLAIDLCVSVCVFSIPFPLEIHKCKVVLHHAAVAKC